MNGEKDFHVENTEETKRSCADTCVLLLDSDDTCLVKLTEMMYRYGYRVVAATSADDLLRIINNKDEKIDLVLAEFRFIEMNKYEVLEKIRSICEIPVVAVGSYVKGAVEECLCRGAIFCLKKPLIERGLQNLWQFIAWRQRDLHSEIDTNPPEKKYPITHTQSLGDELNRTSKNNEVKTEELDEYADELSLGKKRKERANTDTGEHTEKDNGCDLGDEKKPKLICADDLQNGTLEAIPNIEEANKGRKEPTEIKNTGEGSVKAKPGLVCTEEELEKWSTQPVTNLDAFVEYVFEERDFQPLESIGECVGYNEIPLSPQESSNKDVVGQLQMQKIHRALDEEVMQDGIRALDEEVMQDGIRALDEEVMQDGISLSDLEFDLQEGQGCTSDLEKKSNQEHFDEIFTDLAKELKP